MFVKVNSAGICGIRGRIVSTEADVGDGLPGFIMVGYLASEVREAQDRVRTALKNSGFRLPARKVTVNLSPADLRKEGTAFDLPIALAVLGAYGMTDMREADGCLVVGELGLDGKVKPVEGVMSMVMAAREEGIRRCFLPQENVMEGLVVEHMEIVGVTSLAHLAAMLSDSRTICPARASSGNFLEQEKECYDVDYREVNGQQFLRRAAEVAAAGMHNLLFCGPAGTGKTMIARRLPTILPSLSREENIEISRIYSICGQLPAGQPRLNRRPFRSPHHTVTPQGLTGGGRPVRPGELSLASGGVLFLDELTLFRKSAVEILRQPLEEQRVIVSRVRGSYEFPADFMLCAAMNLCPCGYFPDRSRCRCTPAQVRQYMGRLSRPIMERFDICAEAAPIRYEELRQNAGDNESSAAIRVRVERAREVQAARFDGTGIRFNSRMGKGALERFCRLRPEAEHFLERVYRTRGMSARPCHKVLRVARTIADLEGSETLSKTHLAEAVGYRALEEKIWEA